MKKKNNKKKCDFTPGTSGTFINETLYETLFKVKLVKLEVIFNQPKFFTF